MAGYDFVQLGQDLADVASGKPARHGEQWWRHIPSAKHPIPGAHGDSGNIGPLAWAIYTILHPREPKEAARIEAWLDASWGAAPQPWHYGEWMSPNDYAAATLWACCEILLHTEIPSLRDKAARELRRHIAIWSLLAVSYRDRDKEGRVVVAGQVVKCAGMRWEPSRISHRPINVLMQAVTLGDEGAAGVDSLYRSGRDWRAAVAAGFELQTGFVNLDPSTPAGLATIAEWMGDLRAIGFYEVWRLRGGRVISFWRGEPGGARSTPLCWLGAILSPTDAVELWANAKDAARKPLHVRGDKNVGRGFGLQVGFADTGACTYSAASEGAMGGSASWSYQFDPADLELVASFDAGRSPLWWGPVPDAAGLTEDDAAEWGGVPVPTIPTPPPPPVQPPAESRRQVLIAEIRTRLDEMERLP
jgi:hypothetical protein